MSAGGFWNDRPHGFVEEQVERQMKAGIRRDHAAKFARAVAFGGVNEAEAWAIIRDRDCYHRGTDFQIVYSSDLPPRSFRDAWTRRGSNSGLPYVDMSLARPIQWKRIQDAVRAENKRREDDMYGRRPYRLNKLSWQRAIEGARDADELRRVMPDLR